MLLLLGGARSGKSRMAVSLAQPHPAVTFLATGMAGDAEMEARIARHRTERPEHWELVEEPFELLAASQGVPAERCLLIDCLSFWVANLLAETSAAAVEAAAAEAAAVIGARRGPTIAVSNEVGLGVVPASAAGREFRDVLGRVNATWARAARRSFLVVAGRALELASPEELNLRA
jgi:adenosylcobinamide kinase/adenosylcobinamide-phosphate guanylyltransferase